MTDLTRKYSEIELRLFQEEYRAATELERWKDAPVIIYRPSLLAQLDEPLMLAISHAEAAERDTKRIRSTN
jgi:hypothetical protein